MKPILKYCLIILTGVIYSCCHKEVDYYVQSDWVYINHSSNSIRVVGYDDFTIDISETYSINMNGEGPKVVTEESYVAPFIAGSIAIIVDGDKVYNTSKITDRKNYTAEKVDIRHYKFTYTFTDADFLEE